MMMRLVLVGGYEMALQTKTEPRPHVRAEDCTTGDMHLHGERSCDCEDKDIGVLGLDDRIHIGRIRRRDREPDRKKEVSMWKQKQRHLSSLMRVVL